MGFAAGFAGGRGTLDEIFTKMWQGALVGLAVGAVVGGLSYAFRPPSSSLQHDLAEAYRPQQPVAPPPGTGGGPATLDVPPPITDLGAAGVKVASGLAGPGAGVLARHALGAAVNAGFTPLLNAVVVDVSVGAWDLGYVPTLLQRIGVVRFGGTF
jgi:hypothetical protein